MKQTLLVIKPSAAFMPQSAPQNSQRANEDPADAQDRPSCHSYRLRKADPPRRWLANNSCKQTLMGNWVADQTNTRGDRLAEVTGRMPRIVGLNGSLPHPLSNLPRSNRESSGIMWELPVIFLVKQLGIEQREI